MGATTRDAEDRERQAALLRREGVRKDGLRHGLQSAAARALQDPKENDGPETRRGSAEQRAQSEDAEADHEVPFATEQPHKPAADGQHDGVRDEIGRQNPCALLSGGAETASHVREGDIGNARIEDLHERRQGDYDRNHPGIGPWPEGAGPGGVGHGCIRTLGSTDIPSRSRCSASCPWSNTIFTGIRCTTLT